MQAEDSTTLAANEGSTTQGGAQGHMVEAWPSGGVAPPCGQVPSTNSSEGDRSASDVSENHMLAPHLVNVYEEDVAHMFAHMKSIAICDYVIIASSCLTEDNRRHLDGRNDDASADGSEAYSSDDPSACERFEDACWRNPKT